ncbi:MULTISPECIES: type II toxin-antitoxin system RelE/ParE family toxin [unclassified Marinimicrobium]|jgi:plasmid stabilization system protein ParE|uniref:type II toxin-antitoxin system RelE/ParE family toxin n=1 Tax=unclassified Marinimicrobium TaxID=2632100 RepID=UPI000C4FF55B|nr:MULTISPECIES: type II toxin-antitoxin system RelE/ParE family toxin [unclassified Marinimicrobium]MAN51251.1 plasmid stabilization system [Marinimicrobium sp.]|tara:strand:- start:545 stop:835 length:291 start_codon:yes stop_codon:yes gene_type:complete
MPREIVWLPDASKDIARLRNFLKSQNPLAAQRASQRIVEGVRILQDNPEAGVPVENMGDYRDLMLTFGAGEYILRYREETSRIVIVRVRHSKEEHF